MAEHLTVAQVVVGSRPIIRPYWNVKNGLKRPFLIPWWNCRKVLEFK